MLVASHAPAYGRVLGGHRQAKNTGARIVRDRARPGWSPSRQDARSYEGFSCSKTTAAATNRTPWTLRSLESMIGLCGASPYSLP